MRVKWLCFAVLALGAAVAACSSSAATPYDYSSEKQYGYPTAAPTMAPIWEGAAATPAASAAGQPEPAPAATSGDGSKPASVVPNPEDRIIKTGTISIQVANLDASITLATDQMHGLGGWLAGSDRSVGQAGDAASVTYRVPVNRFEDALAAMRRLGSKVLSEHTDSTPVGGQIVDLQARIDNLKASEKAIQAIMEKAKTIGDVLSVEQRLAEVQGQIEQLSGQLGALTDQSAYSTLTVVFQVPAQPTPSPSASPTPKPSATPTPIPWSAGDQAGQAAGALGEVGKAVATVLIWLAILIVPIVVALAIMLLAIAAVAKLLRPYGRRLMP